MSRVGDETTIEISEEGLRIRGLTDSHVMFYEFKINTDLFIDYELDEPFKVVVDSDMLSNIMKRGGTDNVKLEIDSNTFYIYFISNITRKFELELIDADYDTPEPPEVDNRASIIVPSDIIKRACGDAGVVGSNKLKFKYWYDYNRFNITCKSYINRESVSLDYDVYADYAPDMEGDISSMFSLEYINIFLKYVGINDEWMLMLGNDVPLTVKIDSEDMELMFLLAPRFEEEADDY